MLRILTFFMCILAGTAAFATNLSEHQKINMLIDSFETSNITFLRNGQEYDGKWARKHMKEKFDEAKNISTAKDFIERIGNASSQSGLPYSIRFSDGTIVDCSEWLQQKLARIEGRPLPVVRVITPQVPLKPGEALIKLDNTPAKSAKP